jgi:glycosyltransferase involved in cell wall biosynthesis
MKICFAAYEGVLLSKGGPFVKIHSLKYYLEKLGHEVTLFNMWEHTDKLKGFDIINMFGANLALFSFARNLRHRGINYVVNPIFYSRHSATFIKNAVKAYDMMQRAIPGLWMDYNIVKDICSWAELVLPNTTDESGIIRDGFSIPQEKLEIMYNGVSDRFLYGDPSVFKKKYGLENFILTVGHTGPKRKNMLALVKALSEIDHPAVIIGSILDMGESKELLEIAGKNKNITIIDALDNNSDMLASAYAACDTFVLPSQFETPGRAALEAALAGAKVVITPFGGTKDYFKDMAVYPDPYSVESIRDSIKAVLNKPKTEELKNFIKENFTWDKVVMHTVDVYNKVLKNRQIT